MNWFRQNRSLALFLGLIGVGIFGALGLLVWAKAGWDEASSRSRRTAAEWNRLERLSPYPNAENLREIKLQAESYSSALGRLQDQLKVRIAPPVAPMAPNEFQSRLRIRLVAVANKARANKVKLPDNFHLGFDEFISALPNEAAAPLLGQQLEQIEWVLDTLLDARVEAVTSFRRTPLPEERGAVSVPTATKSVERNVVEAAFVSTPGAARKAINRIAAAKEQFCIIRLLHVRNEKQKGPPREVQEESAAPGAGPQASPVAALNFIVGNERIETTAKIEIVRFTL